MGLIGKDFDHDPFDDYKGSRPSSMKEAEGKRTRLWQIIGGAIWLLWLLCFVAFRTDMNDAYRAANGFVKFLGWVSWIITLWLIFTVHRNDGSKGQIGLKKGGLIAGVIITSLLLASGFVF